jgi:hypothetical protein
LIPQIATLIPPIESSAKSGLRICEITQIKAPRETEPSNFVEGLQNIRASCEEIFR